MDFYLDTEFIEAFTKPFIGKSRHYIELISISIRAKNGERYFAFSNEYNYNAASDWVKENVIWPLYNKVIDQDCKEFFTVKDFHQINGKSNRQIADEVKKFVYKHSKIGNPDSIDNWDQVKGLFPVRFYGYYVDYDWVFLFSLFCTMMDLPKGFPMFCYDLKQMLDERVDNMRPPYLPYVSHETALNTLKFEKNFPVQKNEHDSEDDSQFNMDLHEFLMDEIKGV